ncbi:MAG: hypothetical protein HDT32_02040 [Clostridiales bacterium]|nr:hypothetical protein [Clostridiales bacterium]
MVEFFKKAFKDMKESAKAQHEVDVANFRAVKAESKADFQENRLRGKKRKEFEQAKRDAQLAEANERIAKAEKRRNDAIEKRYS